MVKHIAIGYTSEIRGEQWQSLLAPPKKPSNWKEETWIAKLPDALAKQAAESYNIPGVAKVTRLAVREVAPEAQAQEIEPTPEALLEVLSDDHVVVYGDHVRTCLRLLAAAVTPGDPSHYTNNGRLLTLHNITPVSLMSLCGVDKKLANLQSLEACFHGHLAQNPAVRAIGDADSAAVIAMYLGLTHAYDEQLVDKCCLPV